MCSELKRQVMYSTGLYPSPQSHTATSSNPIVIQRSINVSGWSGTAQHLTLKYKPVKAYHYFMTKDFSLLDILNQN